MADTPPSIEQLQAEVAALRTGNATLETTLKKVRADLKTAGGKEGATDAAIAAAFAPIRSVLSLDDTVDPDAIATAVQTRAKEWDSVKAERDAAVAAAEGIKAERNAERIRAAADSALAESGMDALHYDDARALLLPTLEVGKDGAIVTKAAPNVIAGMTPVQHIHGILKAQRPHYWPSSVGGGATGGKHGPAGDTRCFDPRSPEFNVTAQGQYFKRHGAEATARAERQYGGGR